MDIQNVAVIGAGVSGVSSAIHLKNAGLKVTVYERSNTAGGVWVFNPQCAVEPAYPSTIPSVGDSPQFERRLQDTSLGNRGRRDSPAEGEEKDGLLHLLHAPPG